MQMNSRKCVVLSRWPVELIFWVAALVTLYFVDMGQYHHTLCPLGSAGLIWCPGCGLGRAITLLMHGDLMGSVQMHLLGVPALGVLLYRIGVLLKNELSIR